jgi:hypothetical protein
MDGLPQDVVLGPVKLEKNFNLIFSVNNDHKQTTTTIPCYLKTYNNGCTILSDS